MQLVIRNTELFPVQVTFENDQVVNLGPDDVLTLSAGVGAGVVIEEDRIQTRGIAPPEQNMADNDAAASGLTEPTTQTTDTPDQHDVATRDDSSRPDTLHTM